MHIIRTFLLALLIGAPALIAAEKTQPTTPPAAKPLPDTNDVNKRLTESQAAFIAYSMAGNLVRQGKPKDALRYYLTAISSDPKFSAAMNDAALIYKQIGQFDEARTMLHRAIDIERDMSDLYHSLGEVYQAEGLKQLTANDLDAGTANIQEAVRNYGKAIELAEKQGILATRAASYFRLGEICYFANSDLVGAEQYWRHVMTLHAPTPRLHEKTEDFLRLTRTKMDLVTWQRWARQYLDQLNLQRTQVRPQPAQGELQSQARPYTPAQAPQSKSERSGQSTRFWNWKRHNR